MVRGRRTAACLLLCLALYICACGAATQYCIIMLQQMAVPDSVNVSDAAGSGPRRARLPVLLPPYPALLMYLRTAASLQLAWMGGKRKRNRLKAAADARHARSTVSMSAPATLHGLVRK